VDTADAVIIGSGPNGLVAAALLARAGWSVTVLEGANVAGGAVQSAELTEPGYLHDRYSAFYGLLHASPVFAELELGRRLQWASFASPVAAAVSPEDVAICEAQAALTAKRLDQADGQAWLELCEWWTRVGAYLLTALMSPLPSLRPTWRVARAAGWRELPSLARMQVQPIDQLARSRFDAEAARALVSCGASHTDVGVDQPGGVPAALALAMVAQHEGMPIPVGGARRLAEALIAVVEEAGGRVVTGQVVTRVVVEGGKAVGVQTADGGVRSRRAVIADTGPRALLCDLVGEELLPSRYLAGLRQFRYGTGIFKVDLALHGGCPWSRQELNNAGVVHLTGDLDSMARAAFDAGHGVLPEAPMLIVGQQTVADPSRAPTGGHTLWIETHVPSVPKAAGSWAASSARFLDVVLDRLEAHAPGLRSRIVGAAVRTPPQLEAENPNLVGGDLGAGSAALDQQLIFRPVPGWFRYATPVKALYLCSASAHPGGGVHGMGGSNCARRVLGDARLHRI